MSHLKSILTDLGYNLVDYGKYYRSNALYRNGDNKTALQIYKRSGYWIDFVTQESGNLNKLVALTLGYKGSNNEKDIALFMKDKNINIEQSIEVPSPQIPSISMPKTYTRDILKKLFY